MKQGHSRIFEPHRWERQRSGQDAQQDGKQDAEAMDEEILPPKTLPGEMPTYFHVGSLAKECLLRGFKIGKWQIKTRTQTNKNLILSSYGESYPKMDNVFGGFEAYQELGDFHLTLDWLTNKECMADVGMFSELLGGTVYSTLKTWTSQNEGTQFKCKLQTAYERSPFKLEMIVPIYKEPLFKGYILFAAANDWLLGYRTVYNFEEKGFDKHALCVGYSNETTELGLKLENFKDLRGSIFQRMGESWAFAVKTNLYGDDGTVKFAIGGQYDFLNGTLIKARIREDAHVGIVYQTKLSENVEVQYHMGFEGKDPIKGQHKIGVAWSFNC